MAVEDDQRFLRYLDLPECYQPSPTAAPVEFLQQHLVQLPKHLALYFSSLVPPKSRTSLSIVRNRRLNYVQSPAGQEALFWKRARSKWPLLWEQSGTAREEGARPGDFDAADERAWAKDNFLGGNGAAQIGKLGALLGEYEADREAERARHLRRDAAVRQAMMPQLAEEDEDSDDEDPVDAAANAAEDAAETLDQHRDAFERLLKERLVYGLLDVSRFSPRSSVAEHGRRTLTTTPSTGTTI